MLRAAAKSLKFGLAMFGGAVLAGALFLAASLAGALIPARPSVPPPGQAGEKIYLLANFLHADFAIPVTEGLRRRFAFLRDTGVPLDHPALKYLVFGWGSRAFYTNTPTLADIRPGPTLRAITGDLSVLHIVPASDISRLPQAMPLSLPAGGLERLLAFIESSFSRDRGEARPLDHPGYGMGDVFYEAQGGFNIFNPCNVWVAEGLRVAGLSTGAWTPTTYSLKLGISLHAPEALRR